MNCIYLPAPSVCLQMVPFEAQVNWKEYGALMQARGPYVLWHNTHQELTRKHELDKFNNRPDTIVHLDDFKKAIKEALSKASGAQRRLREDL